MKYDTVKDIILNRRSIRKYEDIPVKKEHIKEIINCARWAPSDTNSQPWKFLVTSNKDVINKIEDATQNGMKNIKEKAEAIGRNDIVRKVDVFGRYALVFKQAPTLIICLSEPYSSKFTEDVFKPIEYGNELWREEGIKSTILASQNIMLSAHALGYGTCAMSGPMILAEEEIKKALNIEEKYTIALMIAIGTPQGPSGSTTRKDLEEILEFID